MKKIYLLIALTSLTLSCGKSGDSNRPITADRKAEESAVIPTYQSLKDEVRDLKYNKALGYDESLWNPAPDSTFEEIIKKLPQIKAKLDNLKPSSLAEIRAHYEIDDVLTLYKNSLQICQNQKWQHLSNFDGTLNNYYFPWVQREIVLRPTDLNFIHQELDHFSSVVRIYIKRNQDMLANHWNISTSPDLLLSTFLTYSTSDIQNSYFGAFDFANCAECTRTGFDTVKLQDEIEQKVMKPLKEYDASVQALQAVSHHNKIYSEPLEIHDDCLRAQLKLHSGASQAIDPDVMLVEAQKELQKTELEMHTLLGQALNDTSPAPASSEDLAKEILTRFAKVAASAKKITSQADWEDYVHQVFAKIQVRLPSITSYPLGNPKWDMQFYPEVKTVGGGYDSTTQTIYVTAGPGVLRGAGTWLIAHEGIPGHALQFGVAQSALMDNTFTVENSDAFVNNHEGWGLYSEKLAEDMGLYEDIIEKIYALDAYRTRCLRVISNINIHFKNVSRADAIQFLDRHYLPNNLSSQSEFGRALNWQGRDVSYFYGRNFLMKARAQAQAKLGRKFSLKDFNDLILSQGVTSNKALSIIIDEWMKK